MYFDLFLTDLLLNFSTLIWTLHATKISIYISVGTSFKMYSFLHSIPSTNSVSLIVDDLKSILTVCVDDVTIFTQP